MTATFLLIRHAAHVHLDARLSGRMAGVPLSDEGRADATALGRRLVGERIDRIDCSPLQRTLDTADAIATSMELPPPCPVEALIEIDMGAWTGVTFDSLAGDPAWSVWNERRGTARIPGGENMADAQARIVGHMRDTAAAAPDGTTIALVSHADMIRAAAAYALGLSLDHLLRFDIGPASVTRMVLGDWGTRLISLNERPSA